MWKDWIRLAKNNLVNTIGIFVLITLTIFLVTIFLESNQNMKDSINEIKKENVQDFSFYPEISIKELEEKEYDYESALDEKVKKLADTYAFNWEKVPYKVIKEENNIYRLYSSERKLDRLYFTEGALPEQEQLSVDYSFADENMIEVGDYFNVNGKDYEVSGICVFPDQLYPVVDNSGVPYEKASQALLAFSQESYEKFEIDENIAFAGSFAGSDSNLADMEIDDDFYFITDSSENIQIYSAVNSQSVMNQIIMGFSMGILGTIALLLVIITITRQIKSELSNLGVLKALGYNNREISVKYLGYFVIVLIPAIVGYLAGHKIAPLFYGLIFSRFEIPYINEQININNMLLLTLCPAIFAAAAAYMTSIICVSRPALNLIKDINIKKNGRFVKSKNNKIKEEKYLQGVRKTLLYSNMLIFVFIIFGGFALGTQIQFAYTTYNITSGISDKVIGSMNYESDVRYKNVIEEEDESDNLYYQIKNGKLKMQSGKLSSTLEVCVLGEGNQTLLALQDIKGNEIKINEEGGIVINQLMALQNNLKIGDTVEFISGEETSEVSISNISQSLYGITIYTNEEAALKSGLIQNIEYNGMYTNKNVDYDSDTHISINKVESIEKIINQSSEIYGILAVLLFVCGLVVGTIVLLLSIYGAISNYKKYIAIMKIYGYSEKECSYTVIDGFRWVSLAGFVISIPYTYILCKVMFNLISMNSDMLYPVVFNMKSVLLCFVLTVILTEIIIKLTKTQIKHITFREIMEH